MKRCFEVIALLIRVASAQLVERACNSVVIFSVTRIKKARQLPGPFMMSENDVKPFASLLPGGSPQLFHE